MRRRASRCSASSSLSAQRSVRGKSRKGVPTGRISSSVTGASSEAELAVGQGAEHGLPEHLHATQAVDGLHLDGVGDEPLDVRGEREEVPRAMHAAELLGHFGAEQRGERRVTDRRRLEDVRAVERAGEMGSEVSERWIHMRPPGICGVSCG
jgi:hypothetical protein